MNKALLIIFLLFFGFRSRSQAYIPMLNSYAEWHVTNCYFGCITDKYYTIGDTVIAGLNYKFLDLYHYMKNFLLREDTSERKIYLRFLGGSGPSKDQLLYDFKMNINDTIDVVNPVSPFPEKAGKFVLDSIIVKPLINKNYRYFYLHSLDTALSKVKNTVWVEGIGSLCLINTPGAPPNISGTGQLSCFFNNGVQEYQDLDSISSCQTIYPISVKEHFTFENIISIHPNPGTSFVTIKSGKFYLEGKKIEIINILGKTEFVIEYSNAINVSSLSSGLYFLCFSIDDRPYVLKFVKE